MAGEFRYLGVGEEGDFGTAVGASLFLDFLSQVSNLRRTP